MEDGDELAGVITVLRSSRLQSSLATTFCVFIYLLLQCLLPKEYNFLSHVFVPFIYFNVLFVKKAVTLWVRIPITASNTMV